MPPAGQMTSGLWRHLGAWVFTMYLLGLRKDHRTAPCSSKLLPAQFASISVPRDPSTGQEASKVVISYWLSLVTSHWVLSTRWKKIDFMVLTLLLCFRVRSIPFSQGPLLGDHILCQYQEIAEARGGTLQVTKGPASIHPGVRWDKIQGLTPYGFKPKSVGWKPSKHLGFQMQGIIPGLYYNLYYMCVLFKHNITPPFEVSHLSFSQLS